MTHKLFGYPGGKWQLKNVIVSAFPHHITYVDAFGGSASILLAKEKSDGEVFNDKNREIVNFFRVVKHRPAELVERSRHWIHSRTLFDELRDMSIPFDEVERAFRFWVLLQDSYGSMGLTLGIKRKGIQSVTHARDYLDEVALRLRDVHIECLDFRECIKRYDSQKTFFYLDPPYRNTRGGYTNYDLLSDDDWRDLRHILSAIKGKFLLSSNTDPFVIDLFKEYEKRTLNVRVSLPNHAKGKQRKEMLINNYDAQLVNGK
jgi:DNA adenine methylase